jgi:N6-adenosine-specific RNA methylase IME4
MQIDIFNTTNKYQLIYADPNWKFDTYSDKGKDRSADQHYKTEGLDWIKSLPVKNLADKRCALVMWTIDTHLEMAFEVIKAWGFKYVTPAFYWAKLNKSAKLENLNSSKDFYMGMGYYTRSNPEIALGATNDDEVDIALLSRVAKAPERKNMGVRKLIVSHRREHSRKPDEAIDRLEALFGDVPRIELFSRQERQGWDCWGNEVEKFNESNISK